MKNTIKFVHVNLIAKDWQSLANFYQDVFGCLPVPPERDLRGEALEKGTNLAGAHLRGIHLRLPGFDGTGPTLEIFSYDPQIPRSPTTVNHPGFSHIAFLVDDVGSMQQEVIKQGGEFFGEIVTLQIASRGCVTWCYVTDPEGNLIELQSWD